MFLTKPHYVPLHKEAIPKEMGIYTWVEKESERIAYVGSATGKNGLYHRIWNQHLNPNYLETRRNLFSERDLFQLEHPIYHNGQVAIDKSSFRRKIARRYLLSAGKESVQFIKDHFHLQIIIYPPDEIESILHKKNELIQTYQPIYNGR